MEGHLTDLAAIEWSRFGETRLAPEPRAEVASHLEGCAACREKVAAFGRLDRLMHPYGSPPPRDPGVRAFRRALRFVLLLAGVTALAFLLLSVR